MILFINACVRGESRTRRLAEKLLHQLGDYEEVNLNKTDLQPISEEVLEKRNAYITAGNFNSPIFDYAKQFAAADIIVIAAPYWDFSFPSILRVYLEHIYVTGIVSKYGKDGRPSGLCKAGKLFYVTTAGGPYLPNYSYDYLQHLAKECFGIAETYLIKAEMLDVDGFDVESILCQAEKKIRDIVKEIV